MSANYPQLYAEEFSTNVNLLLQTKGSKLRPLLMPGTHVGNQASPVDQVGSVEAQQVTSRFAPMNRIDAPVDRRWVFPQDWDLPQMVDSFDKLRLISDPESVYVTNALYGLGRRFDDAILTSMFGTASTGVNGATSTVFKTANVVSVDTGGVASSLNVAKLRAGRKLLMSYEVDLDNDPIYCAITSAESDALLNEIQVVSSDFNGGGAKPVLQDGIINRFLGINFIHCERVHLQAGTDDQNGTSNPVPMWAKSGMHFGVWSDITTDVSQRKDVQGLPWQIYAKATFGATRLEEKKIIKIWCH